MGITERHWFEDEEPELTDRQLEDIVYENKKAFDAPKNLEEAIKKLQENNTPLVFKMYCRFCRQFTYVKQPIPYKCLRCNGPWTNYI